MITARGVRFAVAEDADDAAIRRLLRENAMEGAICVTFEREPAYARGANIAGGRDRTIIAFSRDRLVCMGRCTRRPTWVAGQEASVGYLAELRLDAGALGRLDILKGGYRFFRETEGDNPAAAYFTSIGADNDRAIRLLERGGLGLPAYEFLAEFETFLVTVARHSRRPLTVASPEHLPAMVRLLNDHGQRHQLSPVWSVGSLLSLEQHGLPLSRFRLLFEGGELVASGALWDQRAFRQTVIQRYAPLLSFARPILNAVGRPFGLPRLPRPGATLPAAFLSPLALADGAAALLPDFVEGFFAPAVEAGVEFLTVGLPAHSPEAAALRRRFHLRTWRSRFYQVQWAEKSVVDLRGNRAVYFPDVALL
ncbi:hypothetical protein [Chthoniobacter flavus]|uniref:hypothetical protein n=1 Tax=Chthoniobacter flavus TaxID=191863 RepID=UPI0005B26D24|nr:hypothetical protein [Chthoniobacter flavus]